MTEAGYSPAAMFWRQLRKSPVAIGGGVLLLVFYLLALFAPFAAPYPQELMDRSRFYHPPHRIHFFDGHRFVGPFVRPLILVDASRWRYREDETRVLPVRFFVEGAPYELLNLIPTNRHLFGVDAPERIFVLGADPLGRDLWSRLLFGAQISLTVGLVGIAISFSIGLMLGGIAGYFGGWIDGGIIRFT